MDFKKYIPEIEKKIRYKFKDASLLTQAFTRTSFCNEKNRGKQSYYSNEVLEFFGDSVLSTAIVSLLLKSRTERYEHGIKTPLKEGDFSNIRSKLSDKRNLSRTTAALGLQEYLIMGEGDEKLGIKNEPSVMEDLFESIIGAIYIDCGMDMAVVTETVNALIDVSAYSEDGKAAIQSYKNALQEWCADKKHRLPQPVYKTVSESGPDHRRIYERACYIGEKMYGVGVGKNQKLADTAAAEKTLEMLMLEDKKASPSAIEALTKIKEYSARHKLPTPSFHDLGESAQSTANAREYTVECRFAAKSAIGIGPSKQDARAIAAQKILEELEGNKKSAQPTVSAKKKKSKATKKEAAKPEKAAAPKPVEKVQKKSGARPSPRPKKPLNHKKIT